MQRSADDTLGQDGDIALVTGEIPDESEDELELEVPDETEAVEELLWELRGQYTILIVTHNMAQARRASDECIFMLMGKVIEHAETATLFVTPSHRETADYIEGRYG